MKEKKIITLDMTKEQLDAVTRACGVSLGPVTVELVGLNMLSLCGRANSARSLPIAATLSTAEKSFAKVDSNCEADKPFSIELELTETQRNVIRELVHFDWESILLFPEEWDVNYVENWRDGHCVKLGTSFLFMTDDSTVNPADFRVVVKLPKVVGERLSFGTGGHPTTQLILKLLKKYWNEPRRILDVGTGSGILAAVAAKMGGDEVIAFDIDSNATELARKLIELNDLSSKVEVKTATIDEIEGKFDLVLANIFPAIALSIRSELAVKIRPGGMLLMSGIPWVRAAEITEKIESVGFIRQEVIHADIWSGMAFRRDDFVVKE